MLHNSVIYTTYLHDDVERKVHEKIDHEDRQQIRCKILWFFNQSKDGTGDKKKSLFEFCNELLN